MGWYRCVQDRGCRRWQSHAAGPKCPHTPGGDAAHLDPAAPFGSGLPQTPGMKPAGDKFGFAVLGLHSEQWLPLQNRSVRATPYNSEHKDRGWHWHVGLGENWHFSFILVLPSRLPFAFYGARPVPALPGTVSAGPAGDPAGEELCLQILPHPCRAPPTCGTTSGLTIRPDLFQESLMPLLRLF